MMPKYAASRRSGRVGVRQLVIPKAELVRHRIEAVVIGGMSA